MSYITNTSCNSVDYLQTKQTVAAPLSTKVGNERMREAVVKVNENCYA